MLLRCKYRSHFLRAFPQQQGCSSCVRAVHMTMRLCKRLLTPSSPCREGELLAEVAQLEAQLRRQQAPRQAAPAPTSGGSSTESAAQVSAPSGGAVSAPPCGSMEQMHRELFLAAAQQLTAEFGAKVEQVGAGVACDA